MAPGTPEAASAAPIELSADRSRLTLGSTPDWSAWTPVAQAASHAPLIAPAPEAFAAGLPGSGAGASAAVMPGPSPVPGSSPLRTPTSGDRSLSSDLPSGDPASPHARAMDIRESPAGPPAASPVPGHQIEHPGTPDGAVTTL